MKKEDGECEKCIYYDYTSAPSVYGVFCSKRKTNLTFNEFKNCKYFKKRVNKNEKT